VRSQCKQCGGSSICEHGRRRPQCKECGGSSICEHGRVRSQCKECGGASQCEHGRQRSRCKECGDINSKTRKRPRCVSKKKTPSRMPTLVKSSKVAAKLASKDNATASENIGKRAAVQWDDGVYEGIVQSYDELRRLYRICYDDGDTEWIELSHKDVTHDQCRWCGG